MTTSPVSIVSVKGMISEIENQTESAGNLSAYPRTIILPSSPVSVNVKSLISTIENQKDIAINKPSTLKNGKPFDNASTYVGQNKATNNKSSTVQSSELIDSDKNFKLVQIGQQVQHLKKMLNEYKTYSKEQHIYYQNQISVIFADLVKVETKSNCELIDRKSELTEEVKRLNKILNLRLPSEAMKAKDHAESSAMKVTKHVKKEAKVSHKTEKHEKMQKTEYHKGLKIDSKLENAPVPLVKTLKTMFEQNSSLNEVPDRNTNKITRKFKTFNRTSDAKYEPFSEKLKSKKIDSSTEEKIQVRNGLYEKSSKINSSTAVNISDAAPTPPPLPPPMTSQVSHPVTSGVETQKESPRIKSTSTQGDKLQDELKMVFSRIHQKKY